MFSFRHLQRMALLYVVLMAAFVALAFITSGCAALGSAADWVGGQILTGLRQGTIAVAQAGDSTHIVRAYPASTIRLLPGVDSNYVLRSGDRLNVIWRENGEAVVFCEIVADTLSFVRK